MEVFDNGRFFAASIFTLGLLLAAWWAARRFAPGMVKANKNGDKRLSIVDALHLDPRRRLIVVRDGEREHVIILGLSGETLVESRSAAAVPAPKEEETS
jgi:flagellar protein FliO/FliZ